MLHAFEANYVSEFSVIVWFFIVGQNKRSALVSGSPNVHLRVFSAYWSQINLSNRNTDPPVNLLGFDIIQIRMCDFDQSPFDFYQSNY